MFLLESSNFYQKKWPLKTAHSRRSQVRQGGSEGLGTFAAVGRLNRFCSFEVESHAN